MINVPGTKTPGSKDQVAVLPELWPYVVGSVPAHARYSWIRRAFRKACDDAGVERGKITLHDLRHCHGQWAVNNGAVEAHVQMQLRHESPEMTRRYTTSHHRHLAARAAGAAILADRPVAVGGPVEVD